MFGHPCYFTYEYGQTGQHPVYTIYTRKCLVTRTCMLYISYIHRQGYQYNTIRVYTIYTRNIYAKMPRYPHVYIVYFACPPAGLSVQRTVRASLPLIRIVYIQYIYNIHAKMPRCPYVYIVYFACPPAGVTLPKNVRASRPFTSVRVNRAASVYIYIYIYIYLSLCYTSGGGLRLPF